MMTSIATSGNVQPKEILLFAKFNKYANPEKPRAVGVVTGTRNKGYDEMNDINKAKIDVCFEEVKEILETHKYEKVYYSAKSPNGSLATGIFFGSRRYYKLYNRKNSRIVIALL